MYMRPAMGTPTTMKIVCRQCSSRYEADAVGDPEDQRLAAAVQTGVDLGDWSGLLCDDCCKPTVVCQCCSARIPENPKPADRACPRCGAVHHIREWKGATAVSLVTSGMTEPQEGWDGHDRD